MDKHTKHMIIFFVTMLLASVITFSILYLLPLMTSGTDRRIYAAPAAKNKSSRTVHQTNHSPKSLSRLEIYRMTRNALNV
jgi:hypothetical protein